MLLLALCIAHTLAQQAAPQAVLAPPVDAASLGSLGLVGAFDGISRYTFTNEQNSTAVNTESSDYVLAQGPDNFLVSHGQSDGQILASCQLDKKVYFGGHFSQIAGVKANNLASLDTTSGQFSALGSGLDGSVEALYCDSAHNTVYAGGSFEFENSTGVALWSTKSSEWGPAPFGGFPNSSVVHAIAPYQDNILFAGKFVGLANSSFTSGNQTVNSSVIDFKQSISFGTAVITGVGSDPSTQDASDVICPGNDWHLTDNRAGQWQAQFPYSFTPSRLRLYNLQDGVNGLKTFRFWAFPLNGIMNFTYSDTNGQTQSCSNMCPLPLKSSDTPFVDYFFVNPIEMQQIQIDLEDFFGSHAGLSGVELFQSNLVAFANETLNQPLECLNDAEAMASSEVQGPLTQTTAPNRIYLQATVDDPAQLSDLAVTFTPNVTAHGNYSVLMFTPGCNLDGTCTSRGGVNATVFVGPEADPVSQTIFQTNDFDKYDVLYTGPVGDAAHPDFQPKVVLAPLTHGQPSPLTFVADRIQFTFNQTLSNGTDVDIHVNGVFEYNPANFTDLSALGNGTLPVGNSTFNALGGLFNQPAEVFAIESVGKKTFLGGNFSTDQLGSNVLLVGDDGSYQSLPDGGVDGTVNKLLALNDSVVVVGSFTSTNKSSSTSGLQNAASFNTSTSKWTPFGMGLDGEVSSLALCNINGSQAVAFTGSFSNVVSAKNEKFDVTASKLGLWLPGLSSWIQTTPLNQTFVQGHLAQSLLFNSTTYYFGALKILQTLAPGGAYLDAGLNVSPMPFKMVDMDSSSSASNSSSARASSVAITKRAQVVNSLSGNSINTGVYANDTTSVLGGHFSAMTKDGKIYDNLLIVSGESVSGLSNATMSGQSIIYTMDTHNNQLLVGGDIASADAGKSFSGLFFMDLDTFALSAQQPPGINGQQAIVSNIQVIPNTNQIAVMGAFDRVGSLGCPSFCVYDLDAHRWVPPTSGLTGIVSSGVFVGTNLIVLAGEMEINGTTTFFAQYDFDSASYATFPKLSSDLPGPVNSFVLNGNDVDSIFASGTDNDTGSSYLAHWDSKSWTRIDTGVFGPGTVISEVALLQLDTDHSSNNVLPSDQILAVSGSLHLTQLGNVSSAVFDGDSWQPLFLTAKGPAGLGSVNALYSSKVRTFNTVTVPKHMKRGFVVLIALALAFGVVMLMVLLGLLVAYVRRRRQGYAPAPTRVSEQDMTETVPPANLLRAMGNFSRG